jgi:hypothetical protein
MTALNSNSSGHEQPLREEPMLLEESTLREEPTLRVESILSEDSLFSEKPLLEKTSNFDVVQVTIPLGQEATSENSGSKQTLLTMLKNKRESKGLSLQNVEQHLKFKAKWVELLEAGEWSNLPKGASLRGFIKNYSKLLDVDADILYGALNIDLDVDRHTIGRHTSIRAIGEQVSNRSLNLKPIFWVMAGLAVVGVLAALMISGGVFGADFWPESFRSLTQ